MAPRLVSGVTAVLWGASAILFAIPARGSVSIHLEAVEGCPTRQEVSASIDGLLGSEPADDPSRWSVDMVVTPEGEGALRLEIHIHDEGGEGGERSLSGTDCRTLLEAGAVVVALAIGELEGREAADAPPATEPAEVGAPEPAGEPPRRTPEAPPAEPVEEASSPVAPRASSPVPQGAPWHLSAWASFAVGLGALPGAVLGPAAGLGLRRGALRLDLGVAWIPRARAELEGGGGGELTAVDVLLRGCWLPLRGAAELGLCGALDAGWVGAEGFGVDEPGSGEAPWVAPGIAALLAWTFAGPVALRVDALLAVPLHRPGYELENRGEVHRAAPVVGRFTVGLEVGFF